MNFCNLGKSEASLKQLMIMWRCFIVVVEMHPFRPFRTKKEDIDVKHLYIEISREFRHSGYIDLRWKDPIKFHTSSVQCCLRQNTHNLEWFFETVRFERVVASFSLSPLWIFKMKDLLEKNFDLTVPVANDLCNDGMSLVLSIISTLIVDSSANSNVRMVAFPKFESWKRENVAPMLRNNHVRWSFGFSSNLNHTETFEKRCYCSGLPRCW